ncbi:THAP domain-containing protein 6-like isoform 2-T2 [Pholidichthys leucotaenia]
MNHINTSAASSWKRSENQCRSTVHGKFPFAKASEMPRQCAHATCRNVQRKGNGHTFHVFHYKRKNYITVVFKADLWHSQKSEQQVCVQLQGIRILYQFFSFPSGKGNEERRRKWCSLMKRLEGWEPKAWDVVCSQHFKSEDFDMTGQTRRLRDDAVPSQFDLPVHLQKKTRQTQAAKRALQPIQEQQEVIHDYMDHQPSESDRGNLDFDIQVSSIPDFHSYAASDNASLKAKLRRTEDRLAEVERQLKNAKAREKRCKTSLLSIKEEMKENNLMTTDLEERLEAYNGMTCVQFMIPPKCQAME